MEKVKLTQEIEALKKVVSTPGLNDTFCQMIKERIGELERRLAKKQINPFSK